MKRALENGSESQHDDDIVPPAKKGDGSSASRTVSYVVSPRREGSDEASQAAGPVDENDKTVISQRPVAAPEEFYRAMPLSELASILEGRQLDHFAVEQMIGGGGMGAVFRGRDLRLDRVVAIKVIPGSRRDADTLRRFRSEAQAAARLDHPNIARVYYVGEAEQWSYIVFEFIDGVNLRDLVEMEGPLSVDDVVYYARQVAEALQHAHERDVVHRDIKPSNVLVTASGIAKLVDMGLARNTSLEKSTTDATASGVTLGTFDYISPEQARNPRDADVRSDLYSLGCTMFYMLTGHPPFPEGTALQKLLSHGSQPAPDPRAWRDDLSDQLFEILMKLMAKRPADRYQKPSELISDLVMLAELEDLPRSQSPGTVMVTPNIAQRSLVEINLPWMVAFAFLLGSTLWLQSVQSLSNDFSFAELHFASPATAESNDVAESRPPEDEVAPSPEESRPASAAPSPAPTNSNGPGLPSNQPLLPPIDAAPTNDISTTSTTGDRVAIDTLVVSSKKPENVDATAWESSLELAVRRVLSNSEIKVIEVRGPLLLASPLTLSNLNLVIRGEPPSAANASGASIQVSERLLASLDDASGAITVENSALRFSGLSFRMAAPSNAGGGRRHSLFRLSGSAHLELDACTVTATDPMQGDSLRIVSRGLASTSERGTTSDASTRSASNKALMVSLSDCVIRGEACFWDLSVAAEQLEERIDLSVSNTLMALSQPVLRLQAPTGEARELRFVRLYCHQSTFVTERSFAEIEYRGGEAPLLGVSRTSQSSVFWSRPETPHVSITGAPRQSLLGNFSLLVFQGMNNLYDENIENLCQCYLDGETVATFGFTEARSDGWLDERGSESRVRWSQSKIPPTPLSEARPEDYKVADNLFVPGMAPRSPLLQ